MCTTPPVVQAVPREFLPRQKLCKRLTIEMQSPAHSCVTPTRCSFPFGNRQRLQQSNSNLLIESESLLVITACALVKWSQFRCHTIAISLPWFGSFGLVPNSPRSWFHFGGSVSTRCPVRVDHTVRRFTADTRPTGDWRGTISLTTHTNPAYHTLLTPFDKTVISIGLTVGVKFVRVHGAGVNSGRQIRGRARTYVRFGIYAQPITCWRFGRKSRAIYDRTC